MPARNDNDLARALTRYLAMTVAKSPAGPWILLVIAIIVLLPVLMAVAMASTSASHLPSIQEKGPGPYARQVISGEMLQILTNPITKRECPGLSWSILGAIVVAESSAGKTPKGNFNPYPLPRDPAGGGAPATRPTDGQVPSGPSVQRTDLPAGGWNPGQVGMFTSNDPGVALPFAGSVDWVAVKVGGPDAATPEEVQNLKDAGFQIVVWQDQATAEGAAAVAQYGAVGYIAQAEGPGQLDAAVAVQDQVDVPKWLVTNVYDGMEWPDGWGAMPEAYQNDNPNATPERIAARAIQAGADPDRIIIATGSYNGVHSNVGLDEYLPGVQRSGAIGIVVFSGEAMSPEDRDTLMGMGGDPIGNNGRGGRGSAGPRVGITQFTIVLFDKDGRQQVVKFRVQPDITPDKRPKAPGFNNPNNPWDSGYAGDTHPEVARMYGWTGEPVEEWDYEAGKPKYEIDPKTKKKSTKYKYDPSTRGPKGNKIPYYRVPDGEGYALDGDGDGDANINNPADAIPMLARYLCANGAGSLSTLMTAVYNYRPVEWYLFGVNPQKKSFPGIMVLAKRLTAGGEDISPTTYLNPGGYIPGGPVCGGALSLDNEQRSNAAVIKQVAVEYASRGITERDTRIALMVAMQESKLKNLPPEKSDGDSVGMFQQTSSYGSVEQRLDPAFAARGFFNEMLRVAPTGRERIPELELALRIQRPRAGAYESPGNSFESWGPTVDKLMGGGPGPACPAAANGNVESAIQAAFSVLGTPYVWGGESEAGGFDCSGLVWWAFGQAGFPFTRTSAAGEYGWGTPVSRDQLQRGDLLFWAYDTSNPETIHHVAIYLGNGQMVAAPHSGDVVKVQEVYWDGFLGGSRIG